MALGAKTYSQYMCNLEKADHLFYYMPLKLQPVSYVVFPAEDELNWTPAISAKDL